MSLTHKFQAKIIYLVSEVKDITYETLFSHRVKIFRVLIAVSSTLFEKFRFHETETHS